MRWLVVPLLARGNLQLRTVSRGRQRARCVRVVSAGRVVSFFEIEFNAAVFRLISIKEPRGLIGFFRTGKIAKHNEQTACIIVFLRIEPVFFAAERAYYIANDR